MSQLSGLILVVDAIFGKHSIYSQRTDVSDGQTDRQTDRQTDMITLPITALCTTVHRAVTATLCI